MYGLEKEKKGKGFSFDLEKEIEQDPKRAKKILANVETKIQEIKTSLREGTKAEDTDQLGILLSGYNALQKVIQKIAK